MRHLEAEIEWYRSLLHTREETAIRIQRRQNGLPEIAAAAVRNDPDPVPIELVRECARWEGLGDMVLAEAKKEHRVNGTPYDTILNRLREQAPPRETL